MSNKKISDSDSSDNMFEGLEKMIKNSGIDIPQTPEAIEKYMGMLNDPEQGDTIQKIMNGMFGGNSSSSSSSDTKTSDDFKKSLSGVKKRLSRIEDTLSNLDDAVSRVLEILEDEDEDDDEYDEDITQTESRKTIDA